MFNARSFLPAKMPDITPAQIFGAIPILALLLRAFGVYDLSPEQQDALEQAVWYAVALLAGDAVIRNGRAKAVASALNHATTRVAAGQPTGTPQSFEMGGEGDGPPDASGALVEQPGGKRVELRD